MDSTLVDIAEAAILMPVLGLTLVGAGMFGAKLLNIARQALFEGNVTTNVQAAKS